MQNKILFIGPRNNVANPEITGGVIVLFEDLLTYCDANNIPYIYIDTNKVNYKNKLVSYISILYQVVINVKKVQYISLHGTANDYLYIAPFTLILSKIYAKHFSLRKFAGNFIELYEQYSYMKKMLIRFILKYSDVNFFETKYLVEYFQRFNQHTYWFPNVRSAQSFSTSQQFKKKFVYVGAVKAEKGITMLSEVSKLLPEDYTIDIYGTLDVHYSKEYFNDYPIKYKGAIYSKDVTRVISNYDVLILPTYWEGEGYPGIIIEAMSVGMPIIATNLKGIKEMVNDTFAILISQKNLQELEKAILYFTSDNYMEMSKNALVHFKNFDSNIQTKQYLEKCCKGLIK